MRSAKSKTYTISNNDIDYITDEAFRLIREINWKSVEKDNMEFEARITCYQKEALEALLFYAEGMY